MAGDCNLFLNNDDDPQEAEIEIMIAEAQSRGKGLAKEILTLLMGYAIKNLNLNKFVARIGEDNQASRNLFTTLGYVQIGEPNYFKEVLLELKVDTESKKTYYEGVSCC
jgi:RimJ/RimL family protein N-acetyltransferase